MWARLKLYGVLGKLNQNVLYFDTDSIIFKTKKSDDLKYLPIGNYLGNLTNENSPQDGYIVEFVSGALKTTLTAHCREKRNAKLEGLHSTGQTLNLSISRLLSP